MAPSLDYADALHNRHLVVLVDPLVAAIHRPAGDNTMLDNKAQTALHSIGASRLGVGFCLRVQSGSDSKLGEPPPDSRLGGAGAAKNRPASSLLGTRLLPDGDTLAE